jgi:hypothetical protein
MVNPETQTTLDRRHRMKKSKTKITAQKTKKDNQYGPHQNTGSEPRCSQRVTYIIKSGKSLVGDIGKTQSWM